MIIKTWQDRYDESNKGAESAMLDEITELRARVLELENASKFALDALVNDRPSKWYQPTNAIDDLKKVSIKLSHIPPTLPN